MIEEGLVLEPGNALLRAHLAALESPDLEHSSSNNERPPWTKRLVWTRGIWLHAHTYKLHFDDTEGRDGGQGGAALTFEAKPPPWAYPEWPRD